MNLKIDLEKLYFDFAEANQAYELKTAAMEGQLACKKKKEKEAQAALKLKVVINIQAWWRSVMYRKKQGSYRKKEKERKIFEINYNKKIFQCDDGKGEET